MTQQQQVDYLTVQYKNIKESNKAIKKQAKRGWTVFSPPATVQVARSAAGKLFMPLGFFTKKSVVEVTYSRPKP